MASTRTHRRAAFAALALCLCAARAAAQQRNPYEADDVAIRAGTALFANRCADCHGADAKGLRGPDLTKLWSAGASDERVFAAVRAGVPGSIMPPSAAPDKEIWAVVAYLRSISVMPPLASDGDVGRGRAVFGEHCAGCHRVDPAGSAFGPELTAVGQTRSREALVSAIREPSADVPLGYRGATLVTRSGERIEGIVKAEDAFSLQIMTAEQRLIGLRRAELAEVVRHEDSPMPRARLRARQLEDLLAYLGTLRTDGVSW
jgi:putative heme-binding domain-containing protein